MVNDRDAKSTGQMEIPYFIEHSRGSCTSQPLNEWRINDATSQVAPRLIVRRRHGFPIGNESGGHAEFHVTFQIGILLTRRGSSNHLDRAQSQMSKQTRNPKVRYHVSVINPSPNPDRVILVCMERDFLPAAVNRRTRNPHSASPQVSVGKEVIQLITTKITYPRRSGSIGSIRQTYIPTQLQDQEKNRRLRIPPY
ncbi:hypothetical protein BDV40DRAFT_57959 [Aspergillus tamarii]|uniref:Uncharacterized protein n=1 Tax=Aspergillus tamarii TaxID=41984 RepID=A0A5N6V476_ASPTM|nr:hypothetical protein BDV40DRAFT_57959 [Aspergillus tamarii]